MGKKISANIIYNILNQVVTLIVPLILSPYVARVLSAELIGEYSYALANSSYFVLIESLGLSLYGMLKISSNRDNKEFISAIFKEIMIAKILLMVIFVAVYIITFVIFANSNKLLCMIMVLNIISTGIDSTWFLMGMEDFKTTTLRNIMVRIVNVILIITLVKSENDFLTYALIMQSSNVLSFIVVFPTVKKYIMPVSASYKRIIEHIRNSIVYFVPGIINTIFTSADKTVLGAFANNYEVGVYEQASKISTLCGSVINSVSNVVLPRVTYLNHNASKDESKKILVKTLKYASIVSIAVSAGIICVADEFVPLFFGLGYDKSSVLLKILSVNVLMNVLANYIGQQCLVATNKQREYNIAIAAGAVLNLLMNILLVKSLQSEGVSLASAFSAIITFVMIIYFSKDTINIKDVVKITWKANVSAAIMIAASFLVKIDSLVGSLIAKTFLGAFAYVLVLILLRGFTLKNMIGKVFRK